jgi:hypothetical protein
VNRATPTRSNRRIAGVEALRATTAGCTARRAGSERIWVPFEDASAGRRRSRVLQPVPVE